MKIGASADTHAIDNPQPLQLVLLIDVGGDGRMIMTRKL